MEQLPGWQPSWADGVGSQITPPDEQSSTAFAAPIEDEDPNEWEYEYSTTETETYYVTLDLSSPDPDHKPAPDVSTRKTTRWANPAIGRHRRPTLREPPMFAAKTLSTNPEALDPIEEQEETGGAETGVPTFEEPKKPPPVQILGLHSHNPIVSYDGHVYSCEWAENLGTELLFTASAGNPHPYLKTVPGEVDILGAISARIISKAVEIQPRADEQPYVRTAVKKKGGVTIPVGPTAKPARKEQASFLEKLIDVKNKRGEKDMVTVHAMKRQLNRVWKEEFRKKMQNESARLNQIAKAGGTEGVATSRILAEMDKEDGGRLQNERAMGTELKRTRKKRGRPAKNDVVDPVLLAPQSYNLSHATPQSGAQHGDEGIGPQYEYPDIFDGGTPEDFNGSNSRMNEDSPGGEDREEGEDVQMYDDDN